MSPPLSLPDRPSAEQLASLRAELSRANETRGPALPFGIGAVDDRLADHGLDGTGLHEIAAATASLNDDAAATLFAAGIGFERAKAELMGCSIYHLSGEVRHQWEHSIAPIEQLRWSITFRSLSDRNRAG